MVAYTCSPSYQEAEVKTAKSPGVEDQTGQTVKPHSKMKRKFNLIYTHVLTRKYHETKKTSLRLVYNFSVLSKSRTHWSRAVVDRWEAFVLHGITSHSLWSVGTQDFECLNIPPQPVILSLAVKLPKRVENKLPTAEEHPFWVLQKLELATPFPRNI